MANRASKRASKKKRPGAVQRRPTKRVAAKRSSRPAPKKTTRRASVRRASRANPAAFDRSGVITHTEIVSTDPLATRTWCRAVLEWTFEPPMATPTGAYHMWRFANGTGGGIRSTTAPESPGSIPYVEVASIQAAFAKALANGAQGMFGPEPLPGGMGWIAIVAAPGGVAIGFWAKQ